MQPYKRLAVVKFDTWASAHAAYSSPKVMFENRFVKVYWYKDGATAVPPLQPLKDFNGSNNEMANGHIKSESIAEVEPEIDMEEFKRRQDEAQKLHSERVQKKQELERQRQALALRQKELFAKQQEEKQRLLAKMAAASQRARGAGSQSPEITVSPATATRPARTTPQTEALRAQLAALEEEAKQLGIDPDSTEDVSPWTYGRGRGQGGYYRSRALATRGHRGGQRGRGAGAAAYAAYAAYSLDNRPKKVAITGVDFTVTERDEVLRQFLLVSKLHTSLPHPPKLVCRS